MLGVDLLETAVAADEPRGTDPVLAAERITRLVLALVRRERRMALEPVRDARKRALALRSGLRGQVRQLAEPEPGPEIGRASCRERV